CMGILISSSEFSAQKSVRPTASVPKTIAVLLVKSVSYKFLVSFRKKVDRVLILFFFNQFKVTSFSAETILLVNTVPTLLLMTLGLKKSTKGSHTNNKSTPAPSQVRKTAPRFPGFSTDSKTTISAFSFNLISSN